MKATPDVEDARLVDRAPKQERTRLAWTRILDVGLDLLKSGGAEALTITEVCRRSRVSPPSLYARVDGRAGLFAAVYEYGMTSVRSTQDALLLRPLAGQSTPADQAARASRVIAEVFRIHGDFLRPIITLAGTDSTLLTRGSIESRIVLNQLAAAMPSAGARAYDVARTLYAECVLRTMYGADFLLAEGETQEAFEARLAGIALRLMIGEPGPSAR